MALSKPLRETRRARLNYRLWNTLLVPFVPALGAYTLWRRYGQKKSTASLRGQWGKVPDEVVQVLRTHESSTRIWIHAVSVGETLAARPVARALKKAIPDCILVLSTTTDTGQDAARVAQKAGEVDAVFYFPLDLPFPIWRALTTIRPHVFLSMETELWPNFLHLAKRFGARTFLVNGRVSDNLLHRAPKMGALWRWMIGNLDGFLMRSESDAARIKSLGAPSSRVCVTGDVKLDALNTVENIGELRAHWRRVLEIADDAPFLVAGSTHDGEDEPILVAFQQVRAQFPDARLLIAPRHLERVGEVAQTIRAANFEVVLRSEIGALNETQAPNDGGSSSTKTNVSDSAKENVNAQVNADMSENPIADAKSAVLLLDTIGELSQIYAAADATFVGGSLIRRGGHNVLEPVLCGVPVAFGPYIANFREAVALAEAADVGKLVNNEHELAEVWTRWLRDEDWHAGVTSRAEETLREHRGASHRVAEIIAQALAASEAVA